MVVVLGAVAVMALTAVGQDIARASRERKARAARRDPPARR